MRKRAALVDESGTIVNMIVLDEKHVYKPLDPLRIVAETDTPYEIGGNLIGGVYEPPPPPPKPPVLTKRKRLDRMLAAHGLTLADLKSMLGV
jgi:hypothetical protein